MELLLGLLGIALVLGVYVAIVYNGLISKKNLADEAFSGMDVQLKRRSDLIPNLIETVKGYMTHERGTLEKVIEYRARAQSAQNPEDRFKAESALSGLIGNIMVVSENYPDLKASSNFNSLQSELASTEDQIQLARRYYNGAARDLNIAIEQFPSNIIAKQFNFALRPYFEIEDAKDRETPKVSFQ